MLPGRAGVLSAATIRRVMALAGLVALLVSPPATAAEHDGDRALLLSAPPRESPTVSEDVYGPVADFLSEVAGREVIYEHPDNPLLYWKNLQRNRYDIVFDESHFTSWMILNHQHLPLVKVAGALIYVYYINDDTEDLREIGDLAGVPVCGQSPPNQGTLALYEQFENPLRLPYLIPIEGWEKIFASVGEDRCRAGIAPLQLYDQLNNGDKHPLYMTRPVPNQTFSASRRLSPELKSRITAALLSEEGHRATTGLRELYNVAEFERAFEVEYIGHDRILTENFRFDFVSQ